MELINLKGLGKNRQLALSSAGILSCKDLLNYYPYKYYDFSNAISIDKESNNSYLISVTILEDLKNVFIKKLNYCITKVKDNNSDQTISVIWYNQPYLKNNIKVDSQYYLYGKINNKKQFIVQYSYNIENVSSAIVPVYRKINGIGSLLIKNYITQILDNESVMLSFIDDYDKNELKILDAYKLLHFPNSIDDMNKAKNRLGKEDLLKLAVIQKNLESKRKYKILPYKDVNIDEFKSLLKYDLSESQINTINEITTDLNSKFQMNRLVLGDVGSGKTIVALFACYYAIKSGYQACILAPTEILATQHLLTAKEVFKSLNISIELLTNSIKVADKNEIKSRLANGEIDLLITTHSVFSETVVFKNLALAVTDEQHRFGVAQRFTMTEKGDVVDQLLLSATPIPRSLALVFYGGLNVSYLERWQKSTSIKTNIITNSKVDDMWKFISEKCNNGSKCFVVVPRITSKEELEEKITSISDAQKDAESVLQKNEIGIIHGKMEKSEQDLVLKKFKQGILKVVICTTVIEVGVDIPEADIMVIYNADRFGLATMHQLRGRVGRNGKEAFCICINNGSNEISSKRLSIFKRNNDGLKIAEEDLQMRGSGTLYGTNQHGVDQIFSKENFNLQDFDDMKKLAENLNSNDFDSELQLALDEYGAIFEKIVLN